jgi:predicted RNA-binding protein YlqC (UPF0109 family)
MSDLVRFVAEMLVQHPDEVDVREIEPGRLELRVAEEDLGKVIGRRGRTAKALRTLLRVSGGPNAGADLKICEGAENGSE